MEFFDAIDQFLAGSRMLYFYLALGGSVLFVLQLLLMLAGVSHAVDTDAAFDASDVDLGGPGELSMVSFFSLRSLLAFVTFFGWAGFFWGYMGIGGFLIALFAGALMMVLSTLAVWLVLRLQNSGNIVTEDFQGKTGTVYLSLPSGRGMGGQITVIFAGCTRQVKAVADEALAAGAHVRIVEAISPDCFLVEKI